MDVKVGPHREGALPQQRERSASRVEACQEQPSPFGFESRALHQEEEVKPAVVLTFGEEVRMVQAKLLEDPEFTNREMALRQATDLVKERRREAAEKEAAEAPVVKPRSLGDLLKAGLLKPAAEVKG